MARKKAQTAEAHGDAPDVFDQAIADRQAAQPVAEVAAPHTEQPHTPAHNGHAAAAKKRQATQHAKLSIPAGDTVVQLLDKGDNMAGIGIRIAFPEGAKNRPTNEEKEIIREHMKGEEGRPGLTWNRDMGMWHKEIVKAGEHPQDIPLSRPVAIRLDAENRVANLAEALKAHQADPVGYAAQIKMQRELASQGRGLPD